MSELRAYERAVRVDAQQRVRAHREASRQADREDALVDLAARERRLVLAHQIDFAPGCAPICEATPVERDGIRQAYVRRALDDVPLLKPWQRDEARDQALSAAEIAIAAEEQARQDEARREQERADRAWQSLLANDPETVIAALEDAFEDNDVPATALDVAADELSLMMLMPSVAVVPERTGHRTPAGTATTRRRSKTERNDFYSMMLASQLMAAVKEAFATAPGISFVTALVVARSPVDGEPTALWAGRFTREEFEGTDWTDVNAFTLVYRPGQLYEHRGRTRELSPVGFEDVDGLADILRVVGGLTRPGVPDDFSVGDEPTDPPIVGAASGYAAPVSSRIFVSYARSDEKTAAALADHLRQLETGGVAAVWFDRHLELGESWEQRIEREVAQADISLLLISPAYLASTFVNEHELPMIAERGRHGARVIPVVLAPCGWREHPYISTLQAFDQGRELKAPTTITFGRQAADLVEQVRRLATTVAPAKPGPADPAPEAVTPAASDATPASTGRVDAQGIAFKGSQLQTQLYVNVAADVLNAAVVAELKLADESEITWVSPVQATGFAEFSDRRFLEVIGCGHLVSGLKDFWPRGGPRWDALATVALPDGRSGVILGEGKSYPAEMEGGGAKASPASREQIAAAMAETQHVLGLPEDPERWLGRFYQLANRLAHMLWLRRQGVPCWLVHICFTADPHGPTDETTWRSAIAAMHHELGLDNEHLDGVGEVFLPALDRELLVDAR